METAHYDLKDIVKLPLHFPTVWGAVMGRFDAAKWSPIIISLATLLVLLSQIGFGANGMFHDQAKDVQAVQGKVDVLQKQTDGISNQMNIMQTQMATLLQLPGLIQRLNDRLDAAPRADMINSQLAEIQHHLSVQDGRFDTDEKRMKDDEERSIRDTTRIDTIEHSSSVPLGNRR